MIAYDLTAEELAALRAFADQYGRRWKEELIGQWFRAAAPSTLQALRNSHGPRWLMFFKLDSSPD